MDVVLAVGVQRVIQGTCRGNDEKEGVANPTSEETRARRGLGFLVLKAPMENRVCNTGSWLHCVR